MADKEAPSELEYLREEVKRAQNHLANSNERAQSYSAQYNTEREKRQQLEKQLEKLKDSHLGRRLLTWFVIYFAVAALTFGQSWHSTCATSEEGAPRVFCSTLMGGFWPVTVPTRASIWLMNPDRPD